MQQDAKAKRLKVPGATLYYEVRGRGPLLLLIAGGPNDADSFRTLAQSLEDSWTVVTYDPRGNSRSVFDGEPMDQSMDMHGNDATALITEIATELKCVSAAVFGHSGGAQIGLNLCARSPQLVRQLIAHEPPCIPFLDDSERLQSRLDEVVETYEASGTRAAMALFLAMSGMTASNAQPIITHSPFLKANLGYFLAHGVRAIGRYKPDVSALRSSNVVIGVGEDTEGQLANLTSLALAKALALEPVSFPGDHSGWMRKPGEFASRLNDVLS